MEIFDGHCGLQRPLVVPAIALGNFDGVHLGHAALIDAAVSASKSLGGDAVVYTFDPHPSVVLAPTFAPKPITSLRRRLELFADRGVSVSVIEPFTREFAATSATDFATEILAHIIGAKHVVVGYDFTFGKDRSGNAELLAHLGSELGFTVEIIKPVAAHDMIASSTRVRNFVGDANLAGARVLLGRNYDLDGWVVHGQQRGRELGFPTANVEPTIPPLLPAGIYATRIHLLESPSSSSFIQGAQHHWIAATSLGTNPTFEGGHQLTLEPHLLDFEGNLYNHLLRVEFVEYLRGEQRFDSIDSLVDAIKHDITHTRKIFAKNHEGQDK